MTSSDYPVSQRLELFPIHTGIDPENNSLTIGGIELARLAADYGTPLYLYDQATILDAIDRYRQTLAQAYPASSGLTYAGKAYLCLAIASWMSGQGLQIDCSSVNELHIAKQAGVPRDQIVQHGVNKSLQDILAGIRQAGILVVDHHSELGLLREQFRQSPYPFPQIWLRWRPGLSVPTHSHTQTALTDSKFGLSSEEIFEAVQACLEDGLPLTGLHFHLGSNFQELAPIEHAIRKAIKLLVALRTATGWTATSLSPGGGLGIAYHENDLPVTTIEAYISAIAISLQETCRNYALPLPHLQLEPGRSLVGRAGVALYRVGALKQTGERRWILLDGGLADNPRPALYGSRYSALPVEGVLRPSAGSFSLGGPACESGDALAEDLPLPELATGELLAVPASGAYQLSMSSRYNGALRPAVLWMDRQKVNLIQERETPDDLTRHDLVPF
jgi:diaminopimelate decarboxylase